MKKYIEKKSNGQSYLLGDLEGYLDKNDLKNKRIIEQLKSAPSLISNLEKEVYIIGDCGSCPSCACMEAELQFLAVIEAPATVPLMVLVGGLSFT